MTRLIMICLLASAVQAQAPVRPGSVPLTPGVTPTVDAATVQLFLDLAPRVRAIEERQDQILHELYRAHHSRRARRIAFRLQDQSRWLFEATGTRLQDYLLLKDALLGIHRRQFVLRKLREERDRLLADWTVQLAEKKAIDELFVAGRQTIDRQIEREEKRYGELPETARLAVEARFDEITTAFKRPVRMHRADRRELEERAAEGLPPPPFNPYR